MLGARYWWRVAADNHFFAYLFRTNSCVKAKGSKRKGGRQPDQNIHPCAKMSFDIQFVCILEYLAEYTEQHSCKNTCHSREKRAEEGDDSACHRVPS